MKFSIVLLILSIAAPAQAQVFTPPADFTVARLKYGGGGDWYTGRTMIPNLLTFMREHTTVRTISEEAQVEIADDNLFAYPVLFITGHGNIRFTEDEVRRLRTYLERGGFLFANDDYGLDASFRREIARVFPDKRLVELPPSFDMFKSPFHFPDGLPKIHEHDGEPAQAFGIFHEERLVVFYNYSADIANGWEDPDVHDNPPEKREEALQMGANVMVWALTH